MPFLEVKRSPKELEVRQMAETIREEMVQVASGDHRHPLEDGSIVQHSSNRNCSTDIENFP